MFNYIMTDKSVTYETEILWTYWVVGGAARSFLHDRELNIFPTGPTKFCQ